MVMGTKLWLDIPFAVDFDSFRIERNGNSLFLGMQVLDKRREMFYFLFTWYSWFSPCQEIVNTEVGWQGSAGKNGFRVTSRWGFGAGWEWVNSIELWCQTKAFSGQSFSQEDSLLHNTWLFGTRKIVENPLLLPILAPTANFLPHC